MWVLNSGPHACLASPTSPMFDKGSFCPGWPGTDDRHAPHPLVCWNVGWNYRREPPFLACLSFFHFIKNWTIKVTKDSQTWWFMLGTPSLGRLSQEDHSLV